MHYYFYQGKKPKHKNIIYVKEKQTMKNMKEN